MNHPRFRLPGDDDAARQLLKRADSLKLTVYRGDKGGCSVHFEVSGCVDKDDDEETNTLLPTTDAAGMEFVRGLLQEFERNDGQGRLF